MNPDCNVCYLVRAKQEIVSLQSQVNHLVAEREEFNKFISKFAMVVSSTINTYYRLMDIDTDENARPRYEGKIEGLRESIDIINNLRGNK